eukprot:2228253-Prymnesium_polylepis.1
MKTLRATPNPKSTTWHAQGTAHQRSQPDDRRSKDRCEMSEPDQQQHDVPTTLHFQTAFSMRQCERVAGGDMYCFLEMIYDIGYSRKDVRCVARQPGTKSQDSATPTERLSSRR